MFIEGTDASSLEDSVIDCQKSIDDTQ